MAQDTVTSIGRARRALAAAALLLLAPGAGLAAPAPAPLEQEPEIRGYVETLEVQLVLLQATVLDRKGEVVAGLTPADFRLEEDGVPQDITAFGTAEDQPLQVAFLVDVSGSMAVNEKLERAKAAIHRFVGLLKRGDQLALLTFADGDVVVKKGFTSDRAVFFDALRPLKAWGRTALRDALAAAPTILEGAGPGRKAIVMITDGVDNASEMTVFEAIRAAREVPVPIYAVAMSDISPGTTSVKREPDEGRTFFEVLGEFGAETGGQLLPVFAEEGLEDAVAFIEQRLRAQYIVGYRPTSESKAAGFRKIRLETTNPRLSVITRTGYYGGR